MAVRHRERMMGARRQRGEEPRLDGGAQPADLLEQPIEQRAVGEAQPHAGRVAGKLRLVHQLVEAVARHEEPQARVVPITVLADHHLGPVAGALQQRGQAQVVVGVPRLGGRHPVTWQRRAQRREEPVKRLGAVAVKALEGHAVVEEAIEERRHPHARGRLPQMAPVEGFHEEQQHVRPPRQRVAGPVARVHERIARVGERRARGQHRLREAGGARLRHRGEDGRRHRRLHHHPVLKGGARVPQGILGQRIVRRLTHGRGLHGLGAIGMQAPGAGGHHERERDDRHARGCRLRRRQRRARPAPEDEHPAGDEADLEREIAGQRRDPAADVLRLGRGLASRLRVERDAAGGLIQHVADVLEEHEVQPLPAVAVVAHVHGEHDEVDDRHDDGGHAEGAHVRSPSLHGPAREPAGEQHERADHQADDQHRRHAEAGGDEIGADPRDQRGHERARGGRLARGGQRGQQQALRLLDEEQEHPPEDERRQERAGGHAGYSTRAFAAHDCSKEAW